MGNQLNKPQAKHNNSNTKMFKTLALASISAMTMGRDLTLEASHFGERQLRAKPEEGKQENKPKPVFKKDFNKDKFLGIINRINGTSKKDKMVISTQRPDLDKEDDEDDSGKVYCQVKYSNVEVKYDSQEAIKIDMGISVPKGLVFHGMDVLAPKEKCRGYVPMEGAWDDAASRFGTIQEYKVVEDQESEELIMLTGDLTGERFDVDPEELDDRL